MTHTKEIYIRHHESRQVVCEDLKQLALKAYGEFGIISEHKLDHFMELAAKHICDHCDCVVAIFIIEKGIQKAQAVKNQLSLFD